MSPARAAVRTAPTIARASACMGLSAETVVLWRAPLPLANGRPGVVGPLFRDASSMARVLISDVPHPRR